jgi:hypothetical protein
MAEKIMETIKRTCPEDKQKLVERASFFSIEKSIDEYLSLIDG